MKKPKFYNVQIIGLREEKGGEKID